MEIWNAYYKDETLANTDLVRGENIPQGLYHLVCEVLVQHVDGDFLLMQRDLSKSNYGGYYEATAGGSALKGEDCISCIRRELLEETGILEDDFMIIDKFVSHDDQCIYYIFLCKTACDKNTVTLQAGETMAYKWVSEEEFIEFINSGEMIDKQRKQYWNYFMGEGYIQER